VADFDSAWCHVAIAEQLSDEVVVGAH
jgi:hypothetical protein